MRLKNRLTRLLCVFGAATLLGTACAPSGGPPAPSAPAPAAAPAQQVPAPAAPRPAPAATPAPQPAAAAPAPVPQRTQPKQGGVLRFALDNDIPNLDPHQTTIIAVLQVVAPAYSQIVQYDPLDSAKIIPDLAERWEVSKDGLTYTFTFVKNAKWHDGKPFTAQDARFSIDRTRNPPKGMPSPRREIFAIVASMEAPDATTLKVTLKHPSASFLALLALGYNQVVPQHVVEKEGDVSKVVIGTGPFRLKSFVPGVRANLEKNPDYFIKDRPYLSGLETLVIVDPATRLATFRAGQLDLMPPGSRLTPSQVDTLKKAIPGLDVQVAPQLGYDNLILNTKVKPLGDVRVRRAIHLALDRQDFIESVLQKAGDVGGPMPTVNGQWGIPMDELVRMPGYRQPKAADIAEAKKLLAEAGYPNGFSTNLLAVTAQQSTIEVAGAQLRKIGVQSNLRAVPLSVLVDAWNGGNFDIIGVASGTSLDDPDLILGEAYPSTAGRNYGKFVDSRVDEIYELQRREMDPAKRKALVIDLQKRIIDLAPRAILAWRHQFTTAYPYVKSYRIGLGFYNNNKFQDVWLDK